MDRQRKAIFLGQGDYNALAEAKREYERHIGGRTDWAAFFAFLLGVAKGAGAIPRESAEGR